MDLPPGAAGFDNGDSASGVTMVESDGQMELTGTFPPGQSEMTFRYNVPLDGSDELNVKLPLPPRVIATRVVVGAGPKMGLEVAGFPAAEPGTWQDGKRVLMTTKQARARDGIASLMQSTAPTLLSIRLTGIPNPGYGPRIALVLALLATAGGLGFFFTHRNETKLRADQREDLLEARDTLLEEFVVLEKARRLRPYQRLRGALLDALARIERRLEGEDASGAKGGKKGERSKPAKGKKARAKRAPDEAAAAKKKRTGSQAAKARG